jgi:hypothetical protein
MKKYLVLLLSIPRLLLAGSFDEHFGDLKHVRTTEDRKLMGFYSALFDMAEKRTGPAGEIPATLHFIWLGPRPFPEKSAAYVKNWIDLHPGWKVKFWTDLGKAAPDDRMEVHTLNQFPLQELEECYYKSDNFGERSKILRYAILLEEGGVYIDHDAQCLKTIAPLRENYDFFCGMEPLGPTIMSSSLNPSPHLLASTAQHPILKAAKKWLKENWDSLEAQYPGSEPSAIHNRVMHRAFKSLSVGIKEAHNRSGRRDVVFPPDYFSLPGRDNAIYVTHRPRGTWYKNKLPRESKEERLLKEVKREFSRTLLFGFFLAAANVGLGVYLLRKKA